MTVKDDGVGFDQSNSTMGNGLNNMHLRAVRNQGTLEIRSEPGKGTTVSLKLPIH
jgi:signal transduction histidine kinase